MVLKNQNEVHRRVVKYYLMLAVNLLVNSWVWVYNPRALLPEGDKLNNKKLGVAWAGPYLFEGIKNQTMARIGKVDKSGQVVKRFLVHGSNLECAKWAGNRRITRDSGE